MRVEETLLHSVVDGDDDVEQAVSVVEDRTKRLEGLLLNLLESTLSSSFVFSEHCD